MGDFTAGSFWIPGKGKEHIQFKEDIQYLIELMEFGLWEIFFYVAGSVNTGEG